MNAAHPSPVRPLLAGGVIGLIIGIVLGLIYAWLIDPAAYSGGAFPSELTEQDQTNYVKFAVDEYLITGDIVLFRSRLTTFDVEQKVQNLAAAASTYQASGRAAEAQLTANLAATLRANENWDANAIKAGLEQAAARPGIDRGILSEFSRQLSAPVGPAPAQAAAPGGGLNLRLLACLVLLVAGVATIGAVLWIRSQRTAQRQARAAAPEAFAADWDPSGPQPLKSWPGRFTIGQDNYDESFTVETPNGDFLGECGIGILQDAFVPATSPKQVWAFDVWLFDKTDIRTISKVLLSRHAYEDEEKRSKVSSRGDLFEAQVGTTFDIETTALLVQARVDEVEETGEGYFNNLKITLTPYLKPGVDVSADMPVPSMVN
jgi:hypothetical protein